VTPSRHPPAGQASAEYVAALSLVGAVLAGAGAVVAGAGPAIGARVVHVVRTGVCVVAGDVCRPADAAAAGLAPCTVADRRQGRSGGVIVFSLKLRESGEWTVARRSDGSVLATQLRGSDRGVSGGLGVEATPIGLAVGARGNALLSFSRGRAWELPDAATATRFLAAVADGSADDEARWPPTWRFGDVGEEVSGGVGASGPVGSQVSADVAGIEASADVAAGVRTGKGLTTLYFRASLSGLEAAVAGTRSALAGARGPVVVEYTRDGDGPRELAFRVAEPGRGGELVETTARLDLRVPANRAVAARLLRLRAPWPPAVHEDLRAVVRQAVLTGVVERSVYAVDDTSREAGAAVRLGVELGLHVRHTDVSRRLVDATAWTHGSGPRARTDCLAGASPHAAVRPPATASPRAAARPP
jgi:hypothetical protein